MFTIRSVDEAALSSASYLADTIIRNSSDEIQNATGIHVNGQLVGVVTDGAALQQVLDDTLAPYENGDEFHRVAFAQDIELVPGDQSKDQIKRAFHLTGPEGKFLHLAPPTRSTPG